MTTRTTGAAVVWAAEAKDTATVGELISAAFFEEPVTRWLVPDRTDRARIMPCLFGLVAQDAQVAGTVHVLGDYQAAALWFDLTDPHTGEGSQEPDPRYDEVMGPYADRWQALASVMDSHHPGDPHHYLMIIGVRPDLQGHGLGTALLDHHHAHLGAAALPAYLEATSPRSRQLYARHGYEDAGAPMTLPDGPPLFPMWRPPTP
jgi:GNAT superfamily N-acetyltransferase